MLLPLLRSPFQGELLAWLFLHPDGEFSLIELARRLGVSHATASREADRLVSSGLVLERRMGNLRLIRSNQSTVVTRPLTELLAVTFGPMAIVGELLAPIRGVDRAYIYGSWAARYQGEPGPVPGDLDVIVVGAADPDDVFEAAGTAQRRLGREVNVRIVTPAAWAAPGDDPFLQSVQTRPLFELDLAV
ncbi:ArsR family transcriptional regulator [Dactylosporangium maewongense]|uniref:ArsR family transcriptional regulator n=1 Tax=Dactylosporangium maewongense TaxID=634393 RepID=A0ABP4KJV9_9ACTN